MAQNPGTLAFAPKSSKSMFISSSSVRPSTTIETHRCHSPSRPMPTPVQLGCPSAHRSRQTWAQDCCRYWPPNRTDSEGEALPCRPLVLAVPGTLMNRKSSEHDFVAPENMQKSLSWSCYTAQKNWIWQLSKIWQAKGFWGHIAAADLD